MLQPSPKNFYEKSRQGSIPNVSSRGEEVACLYFSKGSLNTRTFYIWRLNQDQKQKSRKCVTGKYRLEGSSRRRCVGGSWDGQEPICVGLSQHYDYSTKEPPTILFRYENGAIAQSNAGELIVAPGTVLHMECLFKRKYGNPTWFIDNYSGRTYPQVCRGFALLRQSNLYSFRIGGLLVLKVSVSGARCG